MRRAAVALAMIGACCPARWSRTDYALEGTFGAELAVDLAQTQGIVANCQEYNPVIGRCGDRVPPGIYTLAVAVLHAAITAVLPPRARTIFQGITIGVEAHTVYFNELVPDHR